MMRDGHLQGPSLCSLVDSRHNHHGDEYGHDGEAGEDI